jgi:hypothetical protein
MSGYSAISGVWSNSEYSRELVESPKSTFSGVLKINVYTNLPGDGKHGSASDFTHVPCFMLMLALTSLLSSS